jgi:hypothetical protein
MGMTISFKQECERTTGPGLPPAPVACTRSFAAVYSFARAMPAVAPSGSETGTEERFSRLYVRSAEATPDSARARYRIAALFREPGLSEHIEPLAAYVGREVGIPQFADGSYSSQWNQFIRECRVTDLLDTITVIYRYLFWHLGEEIAHWWRDAVRKVFSEEKLAYQINDVGGVHPAVDKEFQRNLVSAIAAAQSPRYRNIGQLIESASIHLLSEPANYRQAWRAILSAVEALFGLMFPYVRMTDDEIERHLLPLVQKAYRGDASAQAAARAMTNSFRSWVEAANAYRHQPGAVDVAAPPSDIAILAISAGATFVRWLMGLNESRPEG